MAAAQFQATRETPKPDVQAAARQTKICRLLQSNLTLYIQRDELTRLLGEEPPEDELTGIYQQTLGTRVLEGQVREQNTRENLVTEQYHQQLAINNRIPTNPTTTATTTTTRAASAWRPPGQEDPGHHDIPAKRIPWTDAALNNRPTPVEPFPEAYSRLRRIRPGWYIISLCA